MWLIFLCPYIYQSHHACLCSQPRLHKATKSFWSTPLTSRPVIGQARWRPLYRQKHTQVPRVDEAEIASDILKPLSHTIQVGHCVCVDAMVCSSLTWSSVNFKAFCLHSPVVALLGLHLTQQLANRCFSRPDPLPVSLNCTCSPQCRPATAHGGTEELQGPCGPQRCGASLIQKPEVQKYSKIQSFLRADVTPEEIPYFETCFIYKFTKIYKIIFRLCI